MKPAYVDVRSQLIAIAGFVAISILITIILAVYDPPNAVLIYPKRRNAELKQCSISESGSTIVISHLYSIFLIMLCTYYAVLTRKIPNNFSETQSIAFSMYATCLLWLACIPISFGMESEMFDKKAQVYGIVVSLSAFAVLVCVFFPKTYIILFKPEKNTREKITLKSETTTVGHSRTNLDREGLSVSAGDDDSFKPYVCRKCAISATPIGENAGTS